MPFAAFAIMFSSARPIARTRALKAVSKPVMSIPIMLKSINTKHKYRPIFIIALIKPMVIFSIWVLFKSFFVIFKSIFIKIMPIRSTAKNITIFQALFLKKLTISDQIASQSIIASHYNYNDRTI